MTTVLRAMVSRQEIDPRGDKNMVWGRRAPIAVEAISSGSPAEESAPHEHAEDGRTVDRQQRATQVGAPVLHDESIEPWRPDEPMLIGLVEASPAPAGRGTSRRFGARPTALAVDAHQSSRTG